MGSNITLDTNIIIDYLKGKKNIVEKVVDMIGKKRKLTISTITFAELLSYPSLSDKEEWDIKDMVYDMTIIPVDTFIAEEAGRIRRASRLRLGDSIIAATALVTKSTLVTRDKHFGRLSGISVEIVE